MLHLMFYLVSCAHSLEILGIFPYAGESHFRVFRPIMDKLVQKGHNVTIISLFPLNSSSNKYNHIKYKYNFNASSFNTLTPKLASKMLSFTLVSDLGRQTCVNLNNTSILNLANNSTRSLFDVIIIEHFNTDCFLGLVHKLKSPFIGISSHSQVPTHHRRLGSINSPSYIPNHFLSLSDRMNFFERFENTIGYVVHKVLNYFLVEIPSDNRIEEVFGKNIPSVSDISKKINLLLVNSYYLLSRPRSFAPGIIEIGGVHLNEGVHPLPKDLQNWIESSKDGVIYFSMGSMIKGFTFPEDKRKAFLQAFSRLGQRVLWKWENDTMPGKSNNVMIKKWIPQFDILCHPKVKAFISHGGLLGLTEAVHCGVPVIVMPQFGDQHANAKALEASEGGVVLNFNEVNEDTAYNALKTVLDPEFKKRVEDLSNGFRDRPLSAMDTAIYWIEYVGKHKGAPHLRIPAVDMPLYEYFLLDVIAFILLLITICLFIMFAITKCIFYKVVTKKMIN